MLEKSNANASDMVVFMTAYYFSKVSIRKKKLFPRRKDMIVEMKKQHIEAVLGNDAVISQLGRMDFKLSFNKLSQNATTTFSEEELAKKSHDGIWNQMNWAFKLKSEMTALFDDGILKPSFFFDLEPFLVLIEGNEIEVNSIAFILTNGILCTAFTLYDCKEGRLISHDDVCGRNHHFHLFDIERICYNGENWKNIEKASISQIISENIGKFELEMMNINLFKNGSTYYHSMLIMSKEIKNYEEYAKAVVGVDFLYEPLNNICPTKECEYFSKECFAIVSNYEESDFTHLLYRHIALESLKIYYFVNMIVSYEETPSLSETYQQVSHMEILEHMMNAPILTIEALNNIRQMGSYERLKEAMNFKIAYLNTQQQKKRNENSTLLNLLLYALTLVSTVGTLHDLAKEFDWPVPCVLALVITAFVLLGCFWYIRERNK